MLIWSCKLTINDQLSIIDICIVIMELVYWNNFMQFVAFSQKMVQSEFLSGNINHLVTSVLPVLEPSCRVNATFICYLEPKVFDHFHGRILIPLINIRLPCKHMVQHPGFSKKKWKLMYLQRFWIMLEHCILDWEIWMKQRLVEFCFFYSS